MEETDRIIIENLCKIGCDIDEDVTSLEDFTTEIVIEGVVRCLLAIQPNFQLHYRMPPNLLAQYKLCMEIAKACKDIGYKGDIGYETFLHGSQSEIRKVFTVLIQKLPKVTEQPLTDVMPKDPLENILKKIQSEIISQLRQPWLPYFCKRNTAESCLSFHSTDFPYSGENNLESTKLLNISTSQLIPSLIEKNLSQLATEKYAYKFKQGNRHLAAIEQKPQPILNSRYSLVQLLRFSNIEPKKKKPQPPPKPYHLSSAPKLSEQQPTEEEKNELLKQTLEKLANDLILRESDLSNAIKKAEKLSVLIEHRKVEYEARRADADRQVKLRALLSDAPAHINRMKSLLESNNSKMVELEEQWQEVKKPLEDFYQELLEGHKNSVGERLRCTLEETVALLKKTVEEIRTKEDAIQHLQNLLETLPSSSQKRTFYTQRILSIVANVKKQNEEMNRVLEDVKCVQREINSTQGKVERTFIVTDEMIFRMAKSDETARRIYKQLIQLHTECSDILKLVKESGALSREIKDLEEQVETEQRKNIGNKLQRLRSDLEQICAENRNLEVQLESAGLQH